MPIETTKPYWQTLDPTTITAGTLLDKLATGYPIQLTDQWCDWLEWYNNVPSAVREAAMAMDHETMIKAHATARDPISAAELYHNVMREDASTGESTQERVNKLAAKIAQMATALRCKRIVIDAMGTEINRLKALLWDAYQDEVLAPNAEDMPSNDDKEEEDDDEI